VYSYLESSFRVCSTSVCVVFHYPFVIFSVTNVCLCLEKKVLCLMVTESSRGRRSDSSRLFHKCHQRQALVPHRVDGIHVRGPLDQIG
jgi:hypothetical protein